MKPKNFSKKLVLNKKTIAHLDINEMMVAHGGTADTEVAGCAPLSTLPECAIPNTGTPCVTFGLQSCPTICNTVFPGQPCNPYICQH